MFLLLYIFLQFLGFSRFVDFYYSSIKVLRNQKHIRTSIDIFWSNMIPYIFIDCTVQWYSILCNCHRTIKAEVEKYTNNFCTLQLTAGNFLNLFL